MRDRLEQLEEAVEGDNATEQDFNAFHADFVSYWSEEKIEDRELDDLTSMRESVARFFEMAKEFGIEKPKRKWEWLHFAESNLQFTIDLRLNPKPEPTAIGLGLWQSQKGWEVVQVLHDETKDLFYFVTDDGYTYGKEVGGYGRNELATLYMTEKLTLSPARLFAISPSLNISAAQILNCNGDPVMVEANWEDGLQPLIDDPAFHGRAS